ncbi:hypothetical protein WG909_06560 [Peptostreptococcaceae bacterium AGR-M142]
MKKLILIMSALFIVFMIFSVVCLSLSGPSLPSDCKSEKIKLNNFKLEWRCKD